MKNKKNVGAIIKKELDALRKKGVTNKSAIARHIYSRYPDKFPSLHAVKSSVQYYTGTLGEEKRHFAREHKEYFYTIKDLPQSHAELWAPHIIDIQKHNRILGLFDVHLPFQDNIAVNAAVNFGIEHKANLCLFGGDMLDCYSASDYDKRPGIADMAIEFQSGRQFISLMRKIFGSVLYKVGNHEERWEKFLERNPTLLGLDEFKLDKILGLSGEEYVTDKRIIKAGKLNILHGHELSKGMGSPVSFSKTLFNKIGESAIAGHHHQVNEFTFKRPVSGDLITCWAVGHLGDEHPRYNPMSSSWGHGFVFIEIEKDGTFRVQNKRIINGKVV